MNAKIRAKAVLLSITTMNHGLLIRNDSSYANHDWTIRKWVDQIVEWGRERGARVDFIEVEEETDENCGHPAATVLLDWWYNEGDRSPPETLVSDFMSDFSHDED